MFKSSVKKFPTISERVEEKFLPEEKKVEIKITPVKYKGMTWKELVEHGVVKESKEQNDDVTILRREFMSWDKTQWLTDEIILPTDRYREFIRLHDINAVESMIAELELEIEIHKSYHNTEDVPSLEDQIKFLKKEYEIKE